MTKDSDTGSQFISIFSMNRLFHIILAFIVAFVFFACQRFDPSRDSNLLDLRVEIDAVEMLKAVPDMKEELINSPYKLSVLLFQSDTLVTSSVQLATPGTITPVVFPRLNRNLPYGLRVFGSFITTNEDIPVDIWMLLPQKYESRLRLERIPQSYGIFDWVGYAEMPIDEISLSAIHLSLHPLGEPCLMIIDDWKAADTYSLSLYDSIRIPIGEEANPQYSSELYPAIPKKDKYWLCLFADPQNKQMVLMRNRNGIIKYSTSYTANNNERISIRFTF